MKLILILSLLAIFSTSDAYGFINKGKQRKVAKTHKKVSALRSNATTRKPTVSTKALNTITESTKPVVTEKPIAPKVKSTVDKLQLIEKQHYHGNRELLIKHLQKQIAQKKKKQLELESQSQLSRKTQNNLLTPNKQSATKQQQEQQQLKTSSNGNAEVPKVTDAIRNDVAQPNARLRQSLPETMQLKEIKQPIKQINIEQIPHQVDHSKQNIEVKHTLQTTNQKSPSTHQQQQTQNQRFILQDHNRGPMQKKEIIQPVKQNTIEEITKQVDHFEQNMHGQHTSQTINRISQPVLENIQQNVQIHQNVGQMVQDVQPLPQQNSYNQQNMHISQQEHLQGNPRHQSQEQQTQNQNIISQNQNRETMQNKEIIQRVKQNSIEKNTNQGHHLQQNIQGHHTSKTINRRSQPALENIQQQNVQIQQSVGQMTQDVQSQRQQNLFDQQNMQLSHQQHLQRNPRQTQKQIFIPQDQRPVQQIQQQPQSNINVNQIEQSFIPQQDLMQIQTQFQDRNSIQGQMQMQPMDMVQPLNVIQQQNAAYQHRDQMQKQSNIPETHIPIQQISQQQQQQQQRSHVINQMQPALNQMLPRQHFLMPLNSLSMDPLFQSRMMLPERVVYLNSAGNNNPVPIPTTKSPPLLTTSKPTPMPTAATTRPTTATPFGEPALTMQSETGNLQYQFLEKEMKKQDLEIVKLELEIRALKRAENNITAEQEAKSKTTQPTTTTMHPFLAFGQKKFPFDF